MTLFLIIVFLSLNYNFTTKQGNEFLIGLHTKEKETLTQGRGKCMVLQFKSNISKLEISELGTQINRGSFTIDRKAHNPGSVWAHSPILLHH